MRPRVSGAAACWTRGAVAQMGERCNRTAEVRGSIPLSSTSLFNDLDGYLPGAVREKYREPIAALVVNDMVQIVSFGDGVEISRHIAATDAVRIENHGAARGNAFRKIGPRTS